MNKLIACLALSVFTVASTLHAETPVKAPVAKPAVTTGSSSSATCDDCDKGVCKMRLTKPVLMSPKAAAAAGK